jgi:carbon starvation protein
MISRESEILPIGYGAMLVEGFVSLLALVAACTLTFPVYQGINAKADAGLYIPVQKELASMSRQMEVSPHIVEITAKDGSKQKVEIPGLAARTGGAVTLAVGMSRILGNMPVLKNIKGILSYWYYFAIMFEALFILTTIDTGTRVARFILQEILGKAYKPLGSSTWIPGVILTSAMVSAGWWYLIWNGGIDTIWPMFGVANQLLGIIALAIGTTYILYRSKKKIYALTTFIPFLFMTVTVMDGGIIYSQNFLKLYSLKHDTADLVRSLLTICMLILTVVIVEECVRKWFGILSGKSGPADIDESVTEAKSEVLSVS